MEIWLKITRGATRKAKLKFPRDEKRGYRREAVLSAGEEAVHGRLGGLGVTKPARTRQGCLPNLFGSLLSLRSTIATSRAASRRPCTGRLALCSDQEAAMTVDEELLVAVCL